MPSEDQINRVLSLCESIERKAAGAATLGKRLEFTVLVLSTFTSGAIWLLISEAVPQSALWAGAIASTITTLITLYIGSANLNASRSRALRLHGRALRLLARVRGEQLSDVEFWNAFRNLEHDFFRLKYGRNDEPEVDS